jgi:membrane protein involved in colicin uptake
MEENVKVPFWQKTWFIVLACIFVPPAGLALLWVAKKGGQTLRIVLTVILVFYSFGWLSALFGGGSSTSTEQSVAETEVTSTNETNEQSAADKAAEEQAAEEQAAAEQAAAEQAAAEAAANQPTMGEKNALRKADDYLAFTAFSYSGLIGQLEYEGYSTEEATYAVDNCGADWNEQAAKKAQQYIDYSSFSRSGLIDQLIYEGFSADQAEYGATAVGY